jgi:flagellar assembly factor FliW
MTINTGSFGEMEIDDDSILHFVKPILGFEEYEFFIVIMDDEIGSGIAFLQSITEPELCFFIISLDNVLEELSAQGKKVSLSTESFRQLYGGDYEVFCILNLKEEFMDSTINLKSPVLISPSLQKGMQIVLEADYSVKQRLFADKEDGNNNSKSVQENGKNTSETGKKGEENTSETGKKGEKNLSETGKKGEENTSETGKKDEKNSSENVQDEEVQK